jgi:hypothetical protein
MDHQERQASASLQAGEGTVITIILFVAGVWCLFAGALGPGLALLAISVAWEWAFK